MFFILDRKHSSGVYHKGRVGKDRGKVPWFATTMMDFFKACGSLLLGNEGMVANLSFHMFSHLEMVSVWLLPFHRR